MSFVVYPAIDLIDGKCVRLYQGDYEKETIYEDDPISQALKFESDGAKWIHLVDLDAARTGSLIKYDSHKRHLRRANNTSASRWRHQVIRYCKTSL
ncbi:MAG: hypothetical protein Ct9H90mP11_08420 [Acidimicrobiales bacterium]|nr:MAG: hypothetical protein Ct9H90mP11_08420 [Acidimicrobiales bacterium]